MRGLAVAFSLLAFAIPATTPASADEHTHFRLFVADHTDPVVTAIDLKTGAAAGRFDLVAPATLYTTGSGAAVYAVQGTANCTGSISSLAPSIE